MAVETATANRIALDLLGIGPTDEVLEIGFGHGATLARLATLASAGFVAGVDPSPEMCRMAARRNRRDIERGLVELREARAEALPYDDARFTKILSSHTTYFWPELARPFAECHRVLRPSGRVVIAYRSDQQARRLFPAPVYRFRDGAEVEEALRVAGFTEVRTLRREAGGGVTLSFAAADRSP